MGRRRTGNVLPEGNHYVARVLLDGKYVRIHLAPGTSEARAKEFARFYTENPDRARQALEAQKAARTSATPIPKGETFAEYLERWLKDREERGYSGVQHDRANFARHIVPHIGPKPIVAITREDLEKIVQVFDRMIARRDWSWQTASRVWMPLCKLFKDASGSKNLALRVRKDNPALGIAPPDRGTEKSKAFLFPNEFLKLVSCENVALDLRRLFTLAVYLYCRISEVLQLRWSDIDLEHGIANIRRGYDHERKREKSTKGKRPRGFRIEPNLLPLLRVLYAERDDSGFVIRVLPWKMARRFRDALRTAGITRPDLFMADDLHRQVRFHDLRATGITWMAIRGDTPHVIMQRAGHKKYEITQAYIREAEAIGRDVGEPFPPLPACLLGPSVETPPESGNLSRDLSAAEVGSGQVSGIIAQSGPSTRLGRWHELEPINVESPGIPAEPAEGSTRAGEANPAFPGSATESRQERETIAGAPVSPLDAATRAVRAMLDAALAEGDIEAARRAMRALETLLGEPPKPGKDQPASTVKSTHKRRKA